MKPSKPFCGRFTRFTTAIQDGVVHRNESLTYFAWTFGFVFQWLLQILTVVTYLLYTNLRMLYYTMNHSSGLIAKTDSSQLSRMDRATLCVTATCYQQRWTDSVKIVVFVTILALYCYALRSNCSYCWNVYVIRWLSYLKQPMCAQIMWSFYVTWPKPFSGVPVTWIQRITYTYIQQ